MTPDLARGIVEGAYWLREPGPNADLVVAVTGAPTPEAIEAVGLMAEDRRDIGLLAITSADRLHAGWTAAQRARESGDRTASAPIEDLLDGLPGHCGLVTVVDGIRRHSGGLDRCTAIAPAPSAWSNSARPARWRTSTVTTGSMPGHHGGGERHGTGASHPGARLRPSLESDRYRAGLTSVRIPHHIVSIT